MAAYLHFTVTTQQVSISVNAGETFSIGVTVTNDEEASNKVVDSLSLTLDAGHSASATLFGVAPKTEGAYQWTVEAYNVNTHTVDDVDTFYTNRGGASYTYIWGEGITTEIIVVVVL